MPDRDIDRFQPVASASTPLSRRSVLAGTMGALAATALPIPARAAGFPDHPMRLICPFAPGVSTDVLGRAYARYVAEDLGQPMVLENRSGANGVIASTLVARAPADGYTLLFTTGSHVANAAMSSTLPYRAIEDFTGVFLAAQSYGLCLITTKFSSLAEMVKAAKAAPGKLTYATSGVGNLTHVAGALFERAADIKMTDVPYNSPTLSTDVMGGQVDMTFISTVTAVPLLKSGKVKALATTGSRRTPSLPDVPTLQELGYKDFEVTGYFGMLGPAGMPKDIISILYRAFTKAGETKEVRDLLSESSLYPSTLDPAGFDAFLREDYAYQSKLMKELGLQTH